VRVAPIRYVTQSRLELLTRCWHKNAYSNLALLHLRVMYRGCCPIFFHTKGHKGHKDRRFEQKEAEGTEVAELAVGENFGVRLSSVFFCQLLFKRSVFVFFVTFCEKDLGDSPYRLDPAPFPFNHTATLCGNNTIALRCIRLLLRTSMDLWGWSGRRGRVRHRHKA
jgi:hypothetical protein